MFPVNGYIHWLPNAKNTNLNPVTFTDVSNDSFDIGSPNPTKLIYMDADAEVTFTFPEPPGLMDVYVNNQAITYHFVPGGFKWPMMFKNYKLRKRTMIMEFSYRV